MIPDPQRMGVPRPNRTYPMAALRNSTYAQPLGYNHSTEALSGYDTPVHPATGEELPYANFAEGGSVPETNYYAVPYMPTFDDTFGAGANVPTASPELVAYLMSGMGSGYGPEGYAPSGPTFGGNEFTNEFPTLPSVVDDTGYVPVKSTPYVMPTQYGITSLGTQTNTGRPNTIGPYIDYLNDKFSRGPSYATRTPVGGGGGGSWAMPGDFPVVTTGGGSSSGGTSGGDILKGILGSLTNPYVRDMLKDLWARFRPPTTQQPQPTSVVDSSTFQPVTFDPSLIPVPNFDLGGTERTGQVSIEPVDGTDIFVPEPTPSYIVPIPAYNPPEPKLPDGTLELETVEGGDPYAPEPTPYAPPSYIVPIPAYNPPEPKLPDGTLELETVEGGDPYTPEPTPYSPSPAYTVPVSAYTPSPSASIVAEEIDQPVDSGSYSSSTPSYFAPVASGITTLLGSAAPTATVGAYDLAGNLMTGSTGSAATSGAAGTTGSLTGSSVFTPNLTSSTMLNAGLNVGAGLLANELFGKDSKSQMAQTTFSTIGSLFGPLGTLGGAFIGSLMDASGNPDPLKDPITGRMVEWDDPLYSTVDEWYARNYGTPEYLNSYDYSTEDQLRLQSLYDMAMSDPSAFDPNAVSNVTTNATGVTYNPMSLEEYARRTGYTGSMDPSTFAMYQTSAPSTSTATAPATSYSDPYADYTPVKSEPYTVPDTYSDPYAGYYDPYSYYDPYFYGYGYASGGMTSLPEYKAGGNFLKGPGDGMSDHIPANIDGQQEARLSTEEFVIPADVVSHLGNGSSEAGAKKLYQMMDRVRMARTGTKQQGRQIDPDKFLNV